MISLGALLKPSADKPGANAMQTKPINQIQPCPLLRDPNWRSPTFPAANSPAKKGRFRPSIFIAIIAARSLSSK
jgi:hypothetical protein